MTTGLSQFRLYAQDFFVNASPPAILQGVTPQNGFAEWEIRLWYSLLQRLFVEFNQIDETYGADTFIDEMARLSRLAWHARNLLELNTWTLYCCASIENAASFYKDHGKDAIEILKAGVLMHSTDTTDQANTLRDMAEEAMRHLTELATAKGILDISDSFTPVSEAAKSVGPNHTFRSWYKLFSKFAHPTSFALFHPLDDDAVSAVCDSFYGAGASLGVQSVQHVRDHLAYRLFT